MGHDGVVPVDRHDAPDRPAPGVAGADAVRPQDDARAVTAPAPRVVLGVGASRGCPPAELAALADAVLAEAGLARAAVVAVASVDVKADEPAILALAAGLGVPARFLPAPALAVVDVPTPSAVVASLVGTPSVAEAAALLVAAEPRPSRPDGRPGSGVPGAATGAPARDTPARRNAAGHPLPDTPARRNAAGDPLPDTPARQDAAGDPAPDTPARLVVPKRRSSHATCAVALVATATVATPRPPVPTEVPLP
jgi:hypothetical protein